MNRSSSYGSRLLYHRFIGSTSSHEPSLASDSSTYRSVSPVSITMPPPQPFFTWDMKTTSQPMIPAFKYISQKLAESGLQITLLISEQAPFVIPVWPMSKKSQLILSKIVRRARSKFKVGPNWMNTLATSDRNDLPPIFDVYRPDSYIVKRSLLQREVVFTADGFTLMSMDHIFTLKQLLCILHEKASLSYSRDICLSSCATLLWRIKTIHNGTPFTKGYMERVYLEIPFQNAAFVEVEDAYLRTYCTASIRDISSELDFTTFYDADQKQQGLVKEKLSPVVELPDTAVPHDIVSPVSGTNHHFAPWAYCASSENERRSSPSVNMPWVERAPPSPPSAHETHLLQRTQPVISAVPEEPWVPDASPSPLRIAKRDTTMTMIQGPLEIYSIDPSCEVSEMTRDETTDPSSKYSEHSSDSGSNRLSFQGLKELEAEMHFAEQQEATRRIVEAWSKGVEKSVCARCCDVICSEGVQPARRVTICY